MTDTAQHILTMPLSEMRERVELAERLALAARLTPSGAYAGSTAAVNTATAATDTPAPEPVKPTRARRTKEQIAADEAAAKAAQAPATPEPTSDMSADDMMEAMSTDSAPAASGELSLDEIGTDMMEGFEALDASPPAKTPDEYRALVAAIIKDIQETKDTQRLGVAREALAKVGVQKAGDVPDDKIADFYNMLPKKA